MAEGQTTTAPEPESELLRHRVQAGATHLLHVAEVIRTLAARGENANLLYRLAKDCEAEAALLRDVERFLGKMTEAGA